MTQIGALSERLQSKLEQDKHRIAQITNVELENLQKGLSEASQNALNTIEGVIAETSKQIEQQCSKLSLQLAESEEVFDKALFRAWIRSLIVASGCLIAILITLYLFQRSYRKEVENLKMDIANLEMRAVHSKKKRRRWLEALGEYDWWRAKRGYS